MDGSDDERERGRDNSPPCQPYHHETSDQLGLTLIDGSSYVS